MGTNYPENQYRTIQKPVTVALYSNHSVSGGVTGTWSLDSVKNVLTINSIKFNVANAWNWEAATRKRTITYAGLTASGRSIWAKKVN